MTNFIDVVTIILGIFPSWIGDIIIVVLACVAVLIVLSLVKAILDAIPFV